jgi:hypothetical protein
MIHSEQRIREIAYFLWENEGCPEDRAELHWRAAEAIVDAEDVKAPEKVIETLAKRSVGGPVPR